MNPSGSVDKNVRSFYAKDSGLPGEPAVVYIDKLDASAEGFTGALKVTDGAHDIEIHVGEIIGGSETHVDINNCCQRIVVKCEKFTNVRSEYISSVKGGCVDCSIFGPIAEGPMPSKGVHHIDGNWSDQSRAITSGTLLGYTIADGMTPLVQQLNSSGVFAKPPAKVLCVFHIPCGALGIAVVWFVWARLKKTKNPFTGKYFA